jgi:hypothetical protein
MTEGLVQLGTVVNVTMYPQYNNNMTKKEINTYPHTQRRLRRIYPKGLTMIVSERVLFIFLFFVCLNFFVTNIYCFL